MGSVKGTKKSAPGMTPVVARIPEVRVVTRGDGEKGTRLKVIVSNGSGDSLEVTGGITGAIAHALWQLRGGDDIANWVDAEALTDELLSSKVEQRRGATAPVNVVVPKRKGSAKR